MALFDLKEGFCSSSWGTAKRFCCAPHHQRTGGNEEVCGDWVEWGEFFAPREENGPKGAWIWGTPEFTAYACVAVGRRLLLWNSLIMLFSASPGDSRIVLDGLPLFLGSPHYVERLNPARRATLPARRIPTFCSHQSQFRKATSTSKRRRNGWVRSSASRTAAKTDVLRRWEWYTGNQDDLVRYVTSGP